MCAIKSFLLTKTVFNKEKVKSKNFTGGEREKMDYAINGICHVEIASTDLQRTQQFYGELFGWSFEPFGDEYVFFRSPEGIGGGIAKVPSVQGGNSPTVYYLVNDFDEYMQKTQSNGGKVNIEPTPVADMGWYAVLEDFDGNRFGLWKSANTG